MSEHQLPTWREICFNTTEKLREALSDLTDAGLHMKSDWRPVGTSLTDDAAAARMAVFELLDQVKPAIDKTMQQVHRAAAEPTTTTKG